MADPRWRLFGYNIVIPASYDVIIPRCVPQRKHFWTYYISTKFHWRRFITLGAMEGGRERPSGTISYLQSLCWTSVPPDPPQSPVLCSRSASLYDLLRWPLRWVWSWISLPSGAHRSQYSQSLAWWYFVWVPWAAWHILQFQPCLEAWCGSPVFVAHHSTVLALLAECTWLPVVFVLEQVPPDQIPGRISLKGSSPHSGKSPWSR